MNEIKLSLFTVTAFIMELTLLFDYIEIKNLVIEPRILSFINRFSKY